MRIPAFIHTPPLVLAEPARSEPLGLLGRLIDAIRDTIASREGMKELTVLDDHMLADIGLERSDLPPRPVLPYDFLR